MQQPENQLPIIGSQQQAAQAQRQAERLHEQAEQFKLEARMGEIAHKLLILSGKGGVGKSTVAANLATALARAGKRVGLLDIDVHGPSIPGLMGMAGNPLELAGQQIVPAKVNENLSVVSVGFLLSSDRAPVIWRGPKKHGAIRQFLADVAWGRLDYLIVDSPPGTGDEPLSVAQLIGPSAQAIIVTTPQQVAIADVRRCVTFCGALSLPILGILENMSGMVCPKCGERIDLFKQGGGAALAQEMDVPLLGQIPIDPQIVLSGDEGNPHLGEGPQSAAGSAFSEVVAKILAAGESA